MFYARIRKINPRPIRRSRDLDFKERIGNGASSESSRWIVDLDKRSVWQRKLDEECPYQVVLPRRQLTDDSAILDFLLANVGWFDMYVEDEYAAYVLLLRRPARRRNFPLPF